MAGREEPERTSEIVIIPSPNILTTKDERLVTEAKIELSVQHDLDNFQVQACVSLLNGSNVVLVAPCGSGKLLVFYLAVNILRKKSLFFTVTRQHTHERPCLKNSYGSCC